MTNLFNAFLLLDTTYKLGDLAGLLSLIVAVVGFAITIYQTVRSRHASEQVRDHVLQLSATHGLGGAIRELGDIRRLHRISVWEIMPDRYTSVRLQLLAIKRGTPGLTTDQQSEIQAAVQQIAIIERDVERAMTRRTTPDVDKLNFVVSKQIDRLAVLQADVQSMLQ